MGGECVGKAGRGGKAETVLVIVKKQKRVSFSFLFFF